MTILPTFGFGFVLGIKHAFDADHLIAVSTMLYEHKNPYRVALIGTFWGIGHTTTLFIVGLGVLLLRISITEPVAERLELAVGVMLIILGIQTILKRSYVHKHAHSHGEVTHTHFHQNHNHQHRKSFIIGSIHGFAGSGVLMILVLSLVKTVWEGIIYIILFGIGSTLGMTIITLIIGIPLSKSLKVFANTERFLRIGMGSLSILFGLFVLRSVLLNL